MVKRLSVLFLCLICSHLAYTQTKALRISNELLKKEVLIQNLKRLRVKTIFGSKFSGRLKIIDNEKISIGNQVIRLEDLEKIKRNPLSLTLTTTATMAFVGTYLVIIGYFVGVILLSPEPIFGLAIGSVGAAFIYLGTKAPNPLKGYKKKKGWSYTTIVIEQP